MLADDKNTSPKSFGGGKHLSIMRDMKKNRLLNTAQTTRNNKAAKITFEPGSETKDQFGTFEVQPRILESRVSTR